MVNGFDLNGVDPAPGDQASAGNGDEHAEENPTLTWTAPKSATNHKLYLGLRRGRRCATAKSPEFKGEFFAEAPDQGSEFVD